MEPLETLPLTQPLSQVLADGGTLVTVNNRLARHLMQGYEREQAATGHRVWPTPDILPLSAWLTELLTLALDQGLIERAPLSAHQELLLWEQVIRRSPDQEELLQPTAAAKAAQRSHRLANDWLLSDAELGRIASPETESFLAWRRAFARRCAQDGWIGRSELPLRLTELIEAGELPLPTRLTLAGFDDRSPALTGLLNAARRRDCPVALLEPPRRSALDPRRCAAKEPDQEIRLAARWARDRLLANPGARIGVVAPALQEQHPKLRRIFAEVLHPQALWQSGVEFEPRFNLSLGLPLGDFPLAHDALLALRLTTGQQPHADFAALLRSPYLGGGETEVEARAGLDARLRRDGRPRLDRLRLARRAAALSTLPCPDLLGRLQRVGQRLAAAPASAPPSTWAPLLLGLLEDWGWPGDRRLDSREFQQAKRFHRLIEEFAALDTVLPGLRLEQATQALARLAADSPFQPESGGAPIQILGMLEAGGQDFDHLWLLGLDDQTWPPPAAPDPLLPAALQRQLGMPHASAQRELDFARGLTEQLLAAAPEVIVSHARHDGERELGPSPLIAERPEQAPPVEPSGPWSAAWGETWGEAWSKPGSAPTETITDTQAPAPERQLGGGTDLLASQSACPFRAVASHRLRARPLDEVSHAPDPGMLGDQVHKILASVWQRLGDRAGLLAIDPVELRALIDDSIAAVLTEARRDRPDLYRGSFTELEGRRLGELIGHWLDIERTRGPFRVRQIERREEIELGGLALRVRADRIDQTDSGGLMVIDYKTGAAARSRDWLNERLGEPQVPLYASHLQQTGETVAAAALARVRIDDQAGFVGLSERAGELPGVKPFEPDEQRPDWAALLDSWHDGLLALAEEIRAGRAEPTPSAQACRYCPYPSLCRIADRPEEDGHE